MALRALRGVPDQPGATGMLATVPLTVTLTRGLPHHADTAGGRP